MAKKKQYPQPCVLHLVPGCRFCLCDSDRYGDKAKLQKLNDARNTAWTEGFMRFEVGK